MKIPLRSQRRGRFAGSAALVFSLALTTAATGAAEDSRWLLEPTLFGGATRIGPTSDRGQIGTGGLIDGMRDGAIPQDAAWDSSAGAGLALRYRRASCDLIAEFNWHFRSDWDLSVPTPSLMTVTNVFTNIERASLLFGVDRRWPLNERWTMLGGVRAGLVNHRLRTDYKLRAVGEDDAPLILKDSSRDRSAAYGVELGFERSFAANWSAAFSYRYFDSGEPQIRSIGLNDASFETQIDEHLIRLSLRYRFGLARARGRGH